MIMSLKCVTLSPAAVMDKKEDCPGVTPHPDSSLGKNGTETITYCGVGTYSDMIYVEQTKGEGLPTSGATLYITNGQEDMEVKIAASGPPAASRFWLAGCLINKGYNFTFRPLSQYSIESPKALDPLQCHDLTRLDSSANKGLTVPESARIIVEVVDSRDGKPLSRATAMVANSWESNSRVVDTEGRASIKVDRNGLYTVRASGRGFLPDQSQVEFICQAKTNCQKLVVFSLVPTNSSGELNLVLNWGTSASNLDIHTVQVEASSPDTGCETFFGKKKICENAIVRPANTQSEVLTISNLKSSSRFSYMVFVKDNSPSGQELEESEAHLTVTDGRKTVSRNLPSFTDTTPNGAAFWFVGCLRILENSFVFNPVDTLWRESPLKSQELYCHNLAQNQGPATQETSSPFCADKSLRLRLQTGQNSLFEGSTVENASISVVSTQGGIENVAQLSGLGDFSVKITKGGRYLVQAKGEGVITSYEELFISCDLTKCDECSPTHVISMSPNLGPNSARVMLSWSASPNELKLHVFMPNSSLPLIEKNSFLLDTNTAGMIYVENKSKVPGFSTSTDVRLSLVSSKGQVYKSSPDLTNYGGEIYWLAGCFSNDGGDLKFKPASFFLNTPPSQAKPDFCDSL